MRLIDADKLVRDIKLAERSMVEHPPGMFAMSTQAAIDAINIQRTVDAEPVVHAHWIETDCFDDYGNRFASCSNCGKWETVWDKYCRECGAKMDEEANNAED